MAMPTTLSQAVLLLLVHAVSFLPFHAAAEKAGFLGPKRLKDLLDGKGSVDLLIKLEELDRASDIDHTLVTEARVERLETALVPLFRIAPKDSTGLVDSKAARYLLHRLFSQRHGWFVNGIELQGGLQNTSKVSDALHSGERLSLRQLARFAATLETLIHVENMERLQTAFDLFGFSRTMPTTIPQATQVIEAYMVLYVESFLAEGATFEQRKYEVENEYWGWADTKIFAEEIRAAIFEDEFEDGRQPLLWDACLRVVEEIGERYGKWQNKDCLYMKSNLLQLETPGTGRVPVHKFWEKYRKGKSSMFDESIPYLQQQGALDGEAPRYNVIIPNYLYSSGNCMASSRYYDVCCINECETLLGDVEEAVRKPSATPHVLAGILSNLSSSTVTAPRELPAGLVSRLEGIAANREDGLVPLHGRLFFQALHHAFPRECPYPILSVSQQHERNETWIRRQTPAAQVDMTTMNAYAKVARKLKINDEATELPWSDEEDLFMHSIEDKTPSSADDQAAVTMPLLLMLALGVGILCLRHWSSNAKTPFGAFGTGYTV